jgi:hypothetical protein
MSLSVFYLLIILIFDVLWTGLMTAQLYKNLLMRRTSQCKLLYIRIVIFFNNFASKLDISIKKMSN